MRCVWCGRDVIPERQILGHVCPKCGQPLDISKHGSEKTTTDEAVDSIFRSMAHADQIQKLAWAEYRVDPTFAIGTLLQTVDWLIKSDGGDCTKQIRTLAKTIDKWLEGKE